MDLSLVQTCNTATDMALCQKLSLFPYNWAATWQNQQNGMCAQWRQISLGIRPVWSESSLSAWRKLGSLATHWAQAKTLRRCPGWSESSLGAQSFYWFCHEAAQLLHVQTEKALSGETVHMRRLAWAFTVRVLDKYLFYMGWLIYCWNI